MGCGCSKPAKEGNAYKEAWKEHSPIPAPHETTMLEVLQVVDSEAPTESPQWQPIVDSKPDRKPYRDEEETQGSHTKGSISPSCGSSSEVAMEDAWWLPAQAWLRAGPQVQVAKVLQQYERVGLLRCSLFSKLWLVQSRADAAGSLHAEGTAGSTQSGHEQVALKILDKAAVVAASLPLPEHVTREREVLQAVCGCSPFVVQLVQPIVEDGAQVYMPLSAQLGGDLKLQMLQRHALSESAACFHAACIALALGSLHQRGILHRGVNLENIVLSEQGYPVLVDMGSAKVCGDTLRTRTLCGTPEYAAPEMVKGKDYGAGVDWWALGVLVYRLLAGVLPFVAPSVSEVYNRIQFAPTPMLNSASLDAKELVQKLLTRDPRRRPSTFSDVQQLHWFSTWDWEALNAMEVPSPTDPLAIVPPSRDTEDIVWCMDAL